LIIYAIIVEESVGKMFLAGIVPAIVICFLFLAIIYAWAKINPSIAPGAQPASWSERIRVLPEFLAIAVIFLIIIGGMMKGLFSPTEAGSIGTLAIIILAAVRKELTFKGIVAATIESLRTACMVLTLIAGSIVLGHFLAVTEIPFITADWVIGLPVHRDVVMVIIIIVYLIGGSFIDDLAFLILATPIFFPAVVKLGYDPLWFGIILLVTIMIGVIIPPVAMCVFVVKGITGVPIGIIYRGCLPFILALVAAVVLLFIFPQLAYWLPNLLMK
jgi:C4-dicarboxylate transporter, DctM subunit